MTNTKKMSQLTELDKASIKETISKRTKKHIESWHLKQKKKNDLGTKESPITIGGEEDKGKRERNSYLEI